jgi:deoxyribodipyrimidine photo-lyase
MSHVTVASGRGTVVVWFRRDLRLDDHPALADAAASARRVLPLFVLDPAILEGRHASPARAWFLGRSLQALDAELRARGSALVVRTGRPDVVVPRVAAEVRAEAVLASREITPLGRRRDRAVAEALAEDGRTFHARSGLLLAEPDRLVSQSGDPYVVFTPFWRALGRHERRSPLDAPRELPPLPPGIGDAPLVLPAALAGSSPVADAPEPGEAAAHRRLGAWLREGIEGYAQDRDRLDLQGTSRLSQDLHFGLLSPLRVEAAAAATGGAGSEAFRRQVAWREFYHHLLYHRPEVARGALDPRFTAAFRAEADDPHAVASWREGRTGIPAVDAGMRQLAAMGWLHNRGRLVVASFLTRHLLVDHRVGEAHFMRHLIDGDVASNGGGWQWSAGVGTDAQPWFRIFNPVLQGRRFDPQGRWVRHWVPELERLPDEWVHAPWLMPPDAAEAAGFRPGADYPHPIVDLAEARARALDAFRRALGQHQGQAGRAGRAGQAGRAG